MHCIWSLYGNGTHTKTCVSRTKQWTAWVAWWKLWMRINKTKYNKSDCCLSSLFLYFFCFQAQCHNRGVMRPNISIAWSKTVILRAWQVNDRRQQSLFCLINYIQREIYVCSSHLITAVMGTVWTFAGLYLTNTHWSICKWTNIHVKQAGRVCWTSWCLNTS